MAVRYETEFLLHLRQSPLCIKPGNLPPAEDWMGPPPDNSRTSNRPTMDRSKNHDGSLIDQTNRRPAMASRNSQNTDDIVLGPPRTNFASATLRSSNKTLESDKGTKDTDSRDRFNFRSRNADADGGDRFRDGRTSNFGRRRADNEQDSEGWSTVKPRKSFGHEGAERFHGRMGGGDRYNDRRPREREDRDGASNRRAFDHYTRDKDTEEGEPRPRNGLTRGKSEPWYKSEAAGDGLTTRERIDKAKNWRDRDKDSEPADDKGGARFDRRWGRDREQRVERDPEWMDEPAEEKNTVHTEEDFKRFMETMKSRAGGNGAEEKASATQPSAAAIEMEAPKVLSAPAIEAGPDKFFLNFASSSGLNAGGSAEEPGGTAAKPAGPSRFKSFFSSAAPHGDVKRQTEPPTPMAAPLNGGSAPNPQPPDEDKLAFQQLLLKLQKQTLQAGSAPESAGIPIPGIQGQPQAPPAADIATKGATTSPAPFQPFPGRDHREEAANRPPQGMHEILSPQPMLPQQPPALRQDQLLQNLVGQRGQSGPQLDQNASARNNSNTEFLMNLMKSHAEPPRTEQLMLRMPQPQKQAPMPQVPEREPDFIRDGRIPHQQHHQMRPQGHPAFMDEAFHRTEPDGRASQPTQILQRPPPGLDQMGGAWLQGSGNLPPPQQRPPMMPPPGLVGGPGRNMAMPGPNMFPPNFPPGASFAPPDGMGGMPPRNMPPPPGMYNGPPPPGFFPPPPHSLNAYQGGPGPEPHGFGGPMTPFEGRGMPPPGPAPPRPNFPRQGA